jgi:hypothetical protein
VFSISLGFKRNIEALVGLTSTFYKGISTKLLTSIGIISIVSRNIYLKVSLNTYVGITLLRDSSQDFIESLETVIGLIAEYTPKVGGRVRELATSIGLTATLVRSTYIEYLYTVVGLISTRGNYALSKILSSSFGLKASKVSNISIQIILSTKLGIKSVIRRVIGISKSFTKSIGLIAAYSVVLPHDSFYVTLTASIGLVINKTTNILRQRKWKTLKFLDRKTPDNKQLKIKK